MLKWDLSAVRGGVLIGHREINLALYYLFNLPTPWPEAEPQTQPKMVPLGPKTRVSWDGGMDWTPDGVHCVHIQCAIKLGHWLFRLEQPTPLAGSSEDLYGQEISAFQILGAF